MGVVAVAILAVGVAVLAILALLLIRARRRAARLSRRFELLEEIAAVAERTTSVDDAVDAIAAVLVPAVADFCMIDVIADGRAQRAAVRAAPGGPDGVQAGLAARQPSLPPEMVRAPADQVPAARLCERVDEEELRHLAHAPGDLEFLRGIGMNSYINTPLRSRGRTTGALTLAVAWSGRSFGSGEERFARVLAGRAALALDNAGLFTDLSRSERAREEIAATLQRGLLPPPLPHIRGWTAAAMYRPAGAENEVGGDFYDAFPVAGGWMLVIGDVTGRGARAAAITGQARYTLRTAAALTGDPLVAFSTLNRALLARRDQALCSVAAFALSEDPAQPVRLAVAGHPPPLLVDADGVAETAAPGPLLGAFADAEWQLQRAGIGPGQQLVVVTDGITEARGAGGRFGEERLRAELVGATSPVAAVQRLEGALHAFTDGVLDDDAAILAIARGPGGEGGEDDLAERAMRRLTAA